MEPCTFKPQIINLKKNGLLQNNNSIIKEKNLAKFEMFNGNKL